MTSYREAGVDLAGAERHVEAIAPLVTATWGPGVVGGFGGFAAGIEIPSEYRRPVAMLTTDGVGTKLELARLTGRWDGVGYDLVAMCVDDLAAAGARPIGFVDYLAVGSLQGDRDRRIVESVARACAAAGCALLGGETAEHPGVMEPDQVDLAGTALGLTEHGHELTGADIRPGDAVIGIASHNLRSNGFSLVRKVFSGHDLESPFPGQPDASLGDVLMAPSVIYAPAVVEIVSSGAVHGAAHITGGGLGGNLVRPLPNNCRVTIDTTSWPRPVIFDVISDVGGLIPETMAETFNLGIGFCLMTHAADADSVITTLEDHGHDSWIIGEVSAGVRGVEMR